MSLHPLRRIRSVLPPLLGLALVGGTLLSAPAASAADPIPGVPPVQQRAANGVTADALPTVQIDEGVVWAQAMIGNTVYVGGKFSNARPAGAAKGTNLTARSNLLAYDVTTGNLKTAWAPSVNGTVKAIAVSPDKSRVYVGGSFTVANGATKYNIAAFDPTTGALVSAFKAVVGGSYVNAIVPTDDAVYVGGLIGAAGGITRKNLAALNPADGKPLAWAPTTDMQVDAMVLAPNKDKLIVGGRFGVVNGVGQRGLAALSLTDGAILPWAAPSTVVNGVPATDANAGKAGILNLAVDGSAVYGVGWVFSNKYVGNLEGMFAADGDTGDIRWIADCHGDSNSIYSDGTTVYTTGHAHDCETTGGMPQAYPAPGNLRHAIALTAATKGTLATSRYVNDIYADWGGHPAPGFVEWAPDWVTGTTSGQGSQAGWSTTGNGDYVSVGGEFPAVNGQGQYGLVRFARPGLTTPKEGPRLSGTRWVPSAISVRPGTARVSLPINWDRDDTSLTYELRRGGQTVATRTEKSAFWDTKPLTFNDSGLTPGQTYTYQVRAVDPDGNTANSASVQVTVSDQALSGYAKDVLDDGAQIYWRMGTPAKAAQDWTDNGYDGTVSSGLSEATSGAIVGDSDKGSRVDGTGNGLAVSPSVAAPAQFTAEAWIRTTTTSGGKILGYGNATSGESSSYDRHVYMRNDGRITFGVYPGSTQTATSSAAYNDGQWHHVAASMGSNGMTLTIDGKVVGTNGTTTGQDYSGVWRVGGDNIGGWPNQPSSSYFNGDIDEFAVYPTVLTRTQLRKHYTDAGYTVNVPATPSDAYGAAVRNADPSLYWRFDDANGSTSAADNSENGDTGRVQGGTAFGAAGALGSTGKAATFDGNDDVVVESQRQSNPLLYSTSTWFKTTTTRGGKIIGFGNAESGTSSGYDRHVYMQDDGRLVFGTWLGFTNTVSSPSAYNDGQWHNVVATQSGSGLALYVDGQRVAMNGTPGAQDYEGWWRVGGDTTWGSSSAFFNGSIDEVAIFPRALSDSEVSALYATAKNVPAPTARFTSSANELAASFDGTPSVLASGRPISSYAWTFGDGSTGTGATPQHTYAAAGTYTVTLEVTDANGLKGTTTDTITVARAHQAPVARGGYTADGLTATFADAGSTADGDATIVSRVWDFGDGSTSTQASPSHRYAAAGSYAASLTVTDSQGSTSQAAMIPVTVSHAAPSAAFTPTVDQRKVSVDASDSAAADGATLTYAWSWGDGTAAGSGRTAEHTYAANGTYDVTLTVTDSLGATKTLTKQVTVSLHEAPVPSFTATPTGLGLAVDASASTASDGATLSYAWSWGDGTTAGSGRTATHTYAAAGTYDVRLTLTDSMGGSDTLTKQVTVTAPAEPDPTYVAKDSFGRSVGSGWGTADTGGAWVGTTGASVADGRGVLSVAKGTTRAVRLNVSAKDTDSRFEVSTDKVADGGGLHVNYGVHVSDAGLYRVKLRYAANGTVNVALARLVGTTETLLTNKNLTGFTQTAGGTLQVRLDATQVGSSTQLRAKVWPKGQAEPSDWFVTTTDATAALQGAGGIQFTSYGTGTVTNGPVAVRIDELTVSGDGTQQPPHAAPVAKIDSQVSDLTASLDGTTSTTSDGATIDAYDWSFGDGGTSSASKPSHTYAAAGTYTVSLRVRDSQGAWSTTVTKQVTVTAPTPPDPAFVAKDAFGRSVASGWGTADTGGAWTGTTGASVADGTGVLSVAKGTTRAVRLGVSANQSDSRFTVSSDSVADGGGLHVNYAVHVSDAGLYRVKLRYAANGTVNVGLARLVGTTETLLTNKNLTGFTQTAGAALNVRLQATQVGSSTQLRAKVWPKGQAEPSDWFVTTTDATAALQGAGAVQITSYGTGSITNGPVLVRFDDLTVE